MTELVNDWRNLVREWEKKILAELALAGFFEDEKTPSPFQKCWACGGWGHPKEWCRFHNCLVAWKSFYLTRVEGKP